MKSFYALGLLILSISSYAQTPTINSTYGVTGECTGVVYGNGIFVASANLSYDLSAVFTSADAKTWTPLPSGQVPPKGFTLLAFGNGVFVGVAFPSTIYTSTNGASWTLRSSDIPGIIADIKFTQGAFYAITSTTLYKSTDGINWAPLSLGVTLPDDYNFVSIDYGGGQFVIGVNIPEGRFTPAETGVYHSATADSGSWVFSFADGNTQMAKVMWLKDRFYLFEGKLLTSTDADTWTSPSLVDTLTDGTVGTLTELDRPAAFVAGDSVYLMGVNYGSGGSLSMQVSVDGTHFKSFYPSGMQADGGLSVNDLRIIYGIGGIATSTDGLQFKFNSTSFTGLATNGSGFVAVGAGAGGGHMFSSPDFISWTDRTPMTQNGLTDISSVLYTGTKYVAGGARNIYFSNDGASWSTTPLPVSFMSMGYGAGRFIANAYTDTSNAVLITSTDGINWSVVDTNFAQYYHIRYINNNFFALGISYQDNTGRIMQSADGLHWQNITPATGFPVWDYSDVMYDGTKYYFTGIKKYTDSIKNIFILSTTNPMDTASYGAAGSIVNPAPGTAAGDYVTQFADFVYHNGQFVGSAQDMVDHHAYLLYSSDGMSWTTTPLNGPGEARTIVVDGDTYRIVGDAGGRYSVTFPGPPAKLLDFRAMAVGSRTGENSRLSWRTAGETNIDYFLVQHSLDTLHWDSIGMVNAIERRHGTANYQFTHMDPPAGANYYRLGLIDTNGRRQWSSIRRVDIRNRRNVCIYPNPARGVLHVQLPEPGPATLVVYNNAGRLVRQQVVSGYNATLNLGSLPAGFYHLLIFQGGNRYQKEFIIAEQFSPGY